MKGIEQYFPAVVSIEPLKATDCSSGMFIGTNGHVLQVKSRFIKSFTLLLLVKAFARTVNLVGIDEPCGRTACILNRVCGAIYFVIQGVSTVAVSVGV